MRNEQSPWPFTGGPEADNATDILRHPHVENWVIQERVQLEDAEAARIALWVSLGPHPRQRMSRALVVSIARIDSNWQFVRPERAA